jgi:hypothetical protein
VTGDKFFLPKVNASLPCPVDLCDNNFRTMKNQSMFLKSTLLLCGISAVAVGGALLFVPASFQASAGIILGENAALLSEMRGVGGAILISGIMILMAMKTPGLTFTALLISIALYGGYGVARMISLAVDGTPGMLIVMAMVAELILASLSVIALVKLKKPQASFRHVQA